MSEFFTSVRIYYEDTDSGGIVYYANYLKYMERARTDFLRENGFGRKILLDKHRCIFVVRSVNVNYLKPALLDDLLLIKSRIIKTRRASLEFSHNIENQEGLPICNAQVGVAYIDADTFRPVGLPTELAEVLKH